jgi:hypothetical protein
MYASLESLVNEPPADDVLDIVDSMSDRPQAASFEEYLQDMQDLSHDVAEDVADADRCIEVTQVLGEVVDAVSGRVGEATPAEARLVELVGDMAVAGTDANPEDVVPSMEAYGDGETTMKKVKENIARMWAWLKQLIANIIEKIKLFFKAAFQSSVALDQRLKKLKEEAGKADAAKFKGGKLKISAREATAVAMGKSVPGDLEKLRASLGALIGYRQYFFKEYHAYLTNRLTSLREAIDKFDVAHPDTTLMLLADRLKGVKLPTVPGMSNKSEVELMGQYRIVAENADDQARKQQAASVSAGHYLEISRKTVIEIHRNKDHTAVEAAEITVSNLTDLKTLIETTSQLVNGIEVFCQHPLKEIDAHQADLTKALETLSKKLQQQADKDHGIKAAEHAFSLISNHVASATTWIDQPLRAFTAYAMREAAAVEAIAAKAFKQGTTEEAPGKKEGSQDHKPAGM